MPTVRAMIEVGSRGLALLGEDPDPERRAPLEEMVAFYGYWETELAAALQRWQAEHDGRHGTERT